jgi:hypothetical protein
MVEVSGIVHGKMIELQEDLGLPDGEAVKVIVRQVLPPGEGIRRSAGAWADAGEEFDQWLEGVYRNRGHDREEPKTPASLPGR